MKPKILPFLIILLFPIFFCSSHRGLYVCPPCDLPCDKLSFEEHGECPHCKMILVKRSSLVDESTLIVNQVNIENGSGVFLVQGGTGQQEKTIKVYYYKPENYKPESKIVFVIPGTGRDADEYRDAWIELSEKYSLLILSPMFNEKYYPFEKYHLAGLVQNLTLEKAIEFVDGTNKVNLNEDSLSYSINHNSSEWIFNDFERIFKLVVKHTETKQTKYDIFGHSAGGQILHRMALFADDLSVNAIVSANAGFYTLPNLEKKVPFGVSNILDREEDLKKAFSRNLIVMIGAKDNENETKGYILRSKTLDEQGVHRLERGIYFYQYAKERASSLKAEFGWNVVVIPEVGHNFRKMSIAAGNYLYGESVSDMRRKPIIQK